jgi:DNA-binding beta-propeller fold protein YncE
MAVHQGARRLAGPSPGPLHEDGVVVCGAVHTLTTREAVRRFRGPLTNVTGVTENPPVPSPPTRAVLRCALLAAVVAAAVAGPAQAQSPSGQNAYVAVGGGAVLQFGISGAALSPLAPPSVPTSSAASQIAITSNGTSAYVTGVAGIDQYDIEGDGTLVPKTPASVPLASGAVGIAVTPDNRSVYATNLNSPTVSLFDVGTGGALVPKATPTVTIPGNPFSAGVAVSPDGRSVYVSFLDPVPPNAGGVAQFTVGAGGALTPKSPATVPAGSQGGSVAVSPDGKSVYAVNSGDGTVSQYSVGAGGRLSPKSPPTVGTSGVSPGFIALSPDGAYAYVTNFGAPVSGGGSVAQYTVAADGTLAFNRASPIVTAGPNPAGIAVSADSGAVYVSSAGAVFQFNVASTGRLVPQNTPSVPSAPQSRGLALSPLLASAGPDVLYGTAGNDVIRGKGGDDVIRGLGGHDVLIGGPGRDRLIGGAGEDRLHGGPGRDVIKGGAGRDVIDVRDGARDNVHCGDGRDLILADAGDRVQRCERVVRARR